MADKKKKEMKVERIMRLVLDQEAWNVFRNWTASDERMGAMLLQDNLRKHFSKHIQSFYGKTMFDALDGMERIADILKKKMGVYIRRFDNAKEKAGAIKMYKHIQREFFKTK